MVYKEAVEDVKTTMELQHQASCDLCHIETLRVLTEILKRLPWERAKHVCLSAGQFVTDVDFYEPAGHVFMKATENNEGE